MIDFIFSQILKITKINNLLNLLNLRDENFIFLSLTE